METGEANKERKTSQKTQSLVTSVFVRVEVLQERNKFFEFANFVRKPIAQTLQLMCYKARENNFNLSNILKRFKGRPVRACKFFGSRLCCVTKVIFSAGSVSTNGASTL